jgi:hypothetical protein
MNLQSTLPDEAAARGVAPADAQARRRWPAWRVALVYAVLFGVAVGSIWIIDGHILTTSQPLPSTMSVNR